jgi:mRNA-degrading endonuclease RelE of RelBE toxin-antitoxin system
VSSVVATRSATAGVVRLAKGWEWDDRIPGADRDAILERILLLPAWIDNQLDAANLDVRGLEGSDGFLRLRVGDYRVVFERVGQDAVVHRVDHRAGVYDGLDSLVLVRSGDGLRVIARSQAELPEAATPRRPRLTRAAQFEEAQNPLTPFTDERLASAGLTADDIAAVRRIPAGAAPDEVLAQRGVPARIVRLAAGCGSGPRTTSSCSTAARRSTRSSSASTRRRPRHESRLTSRSPRS